VPSKVCSGALLAAEKVRVIVIGVPAVIEEKEAGAALTYGCSSGTIHTATLVRLSEAVKETVRVLLPPAKTV